jgi:pyruvate formate lyase activating enzyme
MSGRYETVADLLAVIEKERPFFEESGGGVTFSGGEPLLYPKFLIEMLDACGEAGVHRTVDTSGLTSRPTLLEVAKRTDLFLYDLKLMDTQKHREWTGAGNRKILDNLKALAEAGADIQVRVPLIAGVNTDAGNIEATAAFVAALAGPPKPISLLPYHDIARGKAERLGEAHEPGSMAAPGEPDIARIIAQFAEHGLSATVGG